VLESENNKLKRLLAEKLLEVEAMKDDQKRELKTKVPTILTPGDCDRATSLSSLKPPLRGERNSTSNVWLCIPS